MKKHIGDLTVSIEMPGLHPLRWNPHRAECGKALPERRHHPLASQPSTLAPIPSVCVGLHPKIADEADKERLDVFQCPHLPALTQTPWDKGP